MPILGRRKPSTSPQSKNFSYRVLFCRSMKLRRLNSLALLLVLVTAPLSARVIRVEVISRTDVLVGKPFGDTGVYERITGRVYFSVPVANEHNRRIVDLDKATN